MEEGSTKVLHAVFPAWFSLDRGGNGKAWAIHANSASQLWDTHSGPGSPLPRNARRWHWASAACFLLGEGPAAKGREGGGSKGKSCTQGWAHSHNPHFHPAPIAPNAPNRSQQPGWERRFSKAPLRGGHSPLLGGPGSHLIAQQG